MPVVEKAVTGLEGLVSEVLSFRNQIPAGQFLWFRGLPCAEFPLVPRLLRDGKPIEEVFERERRLLTRFRQRSMPYWPAGYPQNDWEHLFAMQHVGLPTRLLDWSENLFVAAFFAFQESKAHAKAHAGACTPVVWCLDPIAWNRSTPVLEELGDAVNVLTTADEDLEAYRPEAIKRRSKFPVAMYGMHNSERIVAQRGTFVVWGNDGGTLDQFSANRGATIWKLKVSGERADLASQIQTLGFTETTVFPELPSLAQELTRTEGWKGG